jgi:hypothetical protein
MARVSGASNTLLAPPTPVAAFVRTRLTAQPLNSNSEVGTMADGSAGFQTCCIADFQVGGPRHNPSALKSPPPAGLETRDTADLEVCATNSTSEFGLNGLSRVQSRSTVQAEDGQLFRAVCSQDQDALDVARAAGARDERDHAGKAPAISLLQQRKSRRQIGNQL